MSAGSNAGLERRRRVVIAGYDGDRQFVHDHLADAEPGVREAALGALDRDVDGLLEKRRYLMTRRKLARQ